MPTSAYLYSAALYQGAGPLDWVQTDRPQEREHDRPGDTGGL